MIFSKVPSTNKIEKLAIFLHSKFCWLNHTDGCGWEYEKSWHEQAHKQWFNKAKAVFEFVEKEI